MRRFGPLQVMVIGFQHANLEGEVMAELRRLRARDLIRLVDLVVVARGTDGLLWSIEASDLDRDEAAEFGAIASALAGLSDNWDTASKAVEMAFGMDNGRVFTDDEVWHVADTIPAGHTAAIAIIEHRWAIGLREAIGHAGGVMLADTWLRPHDTMRLDVA